ncbi:MAG: hypothetical protein K8T26_12720 [Lentisphaerae bacterium]|nr:hypothetical protein [Lentisphaerota bacterium]
MNRTGSGMDWGRIGYGADLQGDRLVLCRAERTRARVTLAVVGADDARWREEAGRGCPVAACVGPRESITQWIDVGFRARQKVLKVLPTVLDIQLPFPLEECAYDFLALRHHGDGKTHALGVAARLADIERKLARFVAAGVDPTLLDQEGLALWTHSLDERPAGDAGVGPSVRVVAYDGVDRATLAIGVGAEFRSAHAVRLEDVAQVCRFLRAAVGDSARAVTWCWAGPGAAGRGGIEALAEALGPEWTCTVHVHADPGTFLARALARRAVQDDGWRCNLRQGRLEHASLARQRGRRTRRAAVLALAAGLLLCGVNVGATWLMRSRTATFEQVFAGYARSLAGSALGAARGEQALLICKRRVADHRRASRPYREYLRSEGGRGLETLLDVAARHGLILEAMAAKSDRVSVGGRGTDWDSAQPLVARLQASGLKARIEREPALPDATVPFTVTGEAVRE